MRAQRETFTTTTTCTRARALAVSSSSFVFEVTHSRPGAFKPDSCLVFNLLTLTTPLPPPLWLLWLYHQDASWLDSWVWTPVCLTKTNPARFSRISFGLTRLQSKQIRTQELVAAICKWTPSYSTYKHTWVIQTDFLVTEGLCAWNISNHSPPVAKTAAWQSAFCLETMKCSRTFAKRGLILVRQMSTSRLLQLVL